jgi:hypothetical protein
MAHRVQAPDGRQWTVRVRWLPQGFGRGPVDRARARLHRGWQRYKQVAFVGEETVFWFWFEAFLWLLGIALVVLLVVPLLAAVVEMLALLPLAVVVIAFRLFRREWIVEVRSDRDVENLPTRGWRAARRLARRVAAEIEATGTHSQIH